MEAVQTMISNYGASISCLHNCATDPESALLHGSLPETDCQSVLVLCSCSSIISSSVRSFSNNFFFKSRGAQQSINLSFKLISVAAFSVFPNEHLAACCRMRRTNLFKDSPSFRFMCLNR